MQRRLPCSGRRYRRENHLYNNLPCGAMRGFGVNQVTFAMESCIDMLCEKGGFDRWQFRYDNALSEGRMTATGQVLRAGVACAIRCWHYATNSAGPKRQAWPAASRTPASATAWSTTRSSRSRSFRSSWSCHHGWTEMGQGVHTVARQVVCQETGLDPKIMESGSTPLPGRAAA